MVFMVFIHTKFKTFFSIETVVAKTAAEVQWFSQLNSLKFLKIQK